MARKTIVLEPPPKEVPPVVIKKKRFPYLPLISLLFTLWFVWSSISVDLPQPDEKPKLYSNQCRGNIHLTLLKAIEAAQSNIYLVMFGLSDYSILRALGKKIDAHVKTTIYYDRLNSSRVAPFLRGAKIYPTKGAGLLHQKILILDKETIFIGSANMTQSSLQMHDNLIIGLVSKPMARYLLEHKPYSPGYFQTIVGGQKVELWLLPDPRGHVFSQLKKKLRAAKKSIKIALFTFTHQGLLDEVIQAHKRGVQVSVVLDMHSGFGASAKVFASLKAENVPVFLSSGVQLLHHKFVYIDNKTLLSGSANWTKSALYKNCDCIIGLNNLDSTQKKFMDTLWSDIIASTKNPS